MLRRIGAALRSARSGRLPQMRQPQQLQLPAAAALLLVVAVLPAAAAAHPREALKGSWHLRLRY